MRSSPPRRQLGLLIGLFLFLLLLLLPNPEGMSDVAQRTAAVAALMAVWWITEAVDIAVTALLPLALYPLLGIFSAQEAAAPYANHIVFLFIGGFILALGMERWNLHRRIALNTIRIAGSDPNRLLLGFMAATAFVSMWISNTATTMMMLPIAIAVTQQLASLAEVEGRRDEAAQDVARRTLGVTLLLGVAYSASIGGIGTIIGSPTNVAFLGYVQETFPQYPPISFLDWSLIGVPLIVIFLPICWWYLCRYGGDLPLSRLTFHGGGGVIDAELAKLGPMSSAEKRVSAVAAATALLWIFRQPIELGAFALPGWSSLFAEPQFLHDSTVAMAAALLLFLAPAGNSERLMDFRTAALGIPWGIVFLLGGGFALAAGIDGSGLAQWIGERLGVLEGAPVWVLVPASCLLAATLTETTSNVATVLMLSPVIGATAVEIGVHPYLLLIPAAIMASFAFMLPVATPPNAIVFASGWITIPRMFRVGLALDLIALAVVPIMVYLFGSRLMGGGL